MSAQAESLRIANALNREWHDDALNYDTALEAADELRRLHAANQDLLDWFHAAKSDKDKAETLLRQALELLEDNREDVARVETTYMHKCYDPVLHAIRQHLGQKGATK